MRRADHVWMGFFDIRRCDSGMGGAESLDPSTIGDSHLNVVPMRNRRFQRTRRQARERTRYSPRTVALRARHFLPGSGVLGEDGARATSLLASQGPGPHVSVGGGHGHSPEQHLKNPAQGRWRKSPPQEERPERPLLSSWPRKSIPAETKAAFPSVSMKGPDGNPCVQLRQGIRSPNSRDAGSVGSR